MQRTDPHHLPRFDKEMAGTVAVRELERLLGLKAELEKTEEGWVVVLGEGARPEQRLNAFLFLYAFLFGLETYPVIEESSPPTSMQAAGLLPRA